MKTRIKVEYNISSVYYYPQYKGWLFWHYFRSGYYNHVTYCNNIDHAQRCIDNRLALESERSKQPKYIEYP